MTKPLEFDHVKPTDMQVGANIKKQSAEFTRKNNWDVIATVQR
jgi:hypothetical protein